jgi:hypothetical protein
MMIILSILLFFVIALPLGWLGERRLMRRYWSRVCTGGEWRRSFPLASKAEIRAFLQAFVDAFGFGPSRRLHFSPDDRVMDVYRTIHPPGWVSADCFELEDFVERLQKDYGIDLVPLWRGEITLGELFVLTRQSAKR